MRIGTISLHAGEIRQPCLLTRGAARPYFTVYALEYQFVGVQQVLGLKLLHRPSGSRIEFDSKEVSYFVKHAMFHRPGQFAVSVNNADRSLQRYRGVDLQADSRE